MPKNTITRAEEMRAKIPSIRRRLRGKPPAKHSVKYWTKRIR